jgi:hypothetical protein
MIGTDVTGNSSESWLTHASPRLLSSCVNQVFGVGNQVQVFPSNLVGGPDLINAGEVFRKNYNFINMEDNLLYDS